MRTMREDVGRARQVCRVIHGRLSMRAATVRAALSALARTAAVT
jgi:hypothetical protein